MKPRETATIDTLSGPMTAEIDRTKPIYCDGEKLVRARYVDAEYRAWFWVSTKDIEEEQR